MEAKAIQRYVRITPRKCNQVLDMIRGNDVEQAQTLLQFTPKLGARIIQKVLKSAVANALHEGKVRVEDLYVKEAVVGAGPTMKRWLPRAPGGPTTKHQPHNPQWGGGGPKELRKGKKKKPQGRATPILKRTSHVSVTVATKE